MDSELIIGAIVAGVVCGLVPLITGLVKGEQSLAWGGFVACIAGGFVLGIILAVPLAILFTVLIVRNSNKRQMAGAQWGAAPGGPESMQPPGAQMPPPGAQAPPPPPPQVPAQR